MAAQAPTVVITNLPLYGSSTPLSGIVLNANPVASKIANFIYVSASGWWSKPSCDQPLTSVQADRSWSTDITTAGSDLLATRVAALLVGTNYAEPCVQGLSFLPTNVFAQALATAVVTRQYPGPRWLNFSGYNWLAKASASLVGPGPNYFSDSTSNLWVDTLGQLHVRITNTSNQWQCAELVSARTFGYGNYRFELNSRVDNLDPNVVLGLFTWSDDPAYAHREIDIECSRWSNPVNSNNAQFVVQPFNLSGHLVRFAIPSGLTNCTLSFTWETNRISFQALRGGYSPLPYPSNVLAVWSYSLAVPLTGDENARVNLWLNSGQPPTDNQEPEVILKSFQFVPLGPTLPARLLNFNRSANRQARFWIDGEFDRRYQVQSSGDLSVWQSGPTILATNIPTEYDDATAQAAGELFYRTMTVP